MVKPSLRSILIGTAVAGVVGIAIVTRSQLVGKEIPAQGPYGLVPDTGHVRTLAYETLPKPDTFFVKFRETGWCSEVIEHNHLVVRNPPRYCTFTKVVGDAQYDGTPDFVSNDLKRSWFDHRRLTAPENDSELLCNVYRKLGFFGPPSGEQCAAD